MILCALKHDLFGSKNINQVIEESLFEVGIIPDNETWYKGKPIMITRNDYFLNLFNGDIGIVHMDHKDNKLKVFFEIEGGYRSISLF